jgi:hypothetical protein
MTLYRVTVHEHIIYDSFVEAENEDIAESLVEEQILEDDKRKWRVDYHAGWTETGEIYLANEEELENAELL